MAELGDTGQLLSLRFRMRWVLKVKDAIPFFPPVNCDSEIKYVLKIT